MKFLLLAIITLLPTYLIRFHIGPFPTTFLELLLLSTFLYWCVKKIKERSGAFPLSGIDDQSGHGSADEAESEGRRAVSRRAGAASEAKGDAPERALLSPIILFLLASTISIFVAPDLRAALGLWRAYIIEPILFFLMFMDTARRGWPMAWRDVTIALSLSALGVALPAIYQKFNPIGIPNIHWATAETRRVTSWYGFPNALGLYLGPIVPFLVGWLYSPHAPSLSSKERVRVRFVKCYVLCVALISLVAIIFARSEGALTALVIVGFVAGFAATRTRLFTTVVALVFIIATFTNTPWRTYLYDQITLRREAGPVRLMQWKETARMLRDRPLLGAGLSGYPTTIAPYHTAKHIEIYQYPHNIILNFWSELGLLGVISFLWLVIVFYRNNFRDIKNLKSEILNLKFVLLASMSIILIHGLVDVPYFKNDLAIFFWLLLALTFSPKASSVKEK